MKKYQKPKITEKKCEISFFLSNSFFSDALGFFVGDVVYAQSGTSASSNCNNSCGSNCSAPGSGSDTGTVGSVGT